MDDRDYEPVADPVLNVLREGLADALGSLDRIIALQQQIIDLLTDPRKPKRLGSR